MTNESTRIYCGLTGQFLYSHRLISLYRERIVQNIEIHGQEVFSSIHHIYYLFTDTFVLIRLAPRVFLEGTHKFYPSVEYRVIDSQIAF